MQENDALLEKRGLRRCESLEASYKSFKCFAKWYSTQKERFKTVPEAREYIVGIVEQYLQPLDKKVLPSKHFHMTIAFLNEEGNYLTKPWVAAVSKREGKLYYSVYDGEIATIHSEPYEKACALVKTQKK